MSSVPATMTAVEIIGKGGPEVLRVGEISTPTPGVGQVLIAVEAAGLNRPDIMQRSGTYPAPKGHSTIPGLEVSGTIAVVGEGVSSHKPGDQVMALVNGGGYAHFCVAEEGSCLPIPDNLSMEEAAAVPETFFTVWHNVFERAKLEPGEWFMVHGGASGIGVTAIQLANAFEAKVITTAGSAEKCEACVTLGAARAINYREEDFVEIVKEVTLKRGVDVILDMVGGDYIARNIKSLSDDGRLVNIAYQKGSKAEIDFLKVMLKRLTITGSTLRIRPPQIKARIAQGLKNKVLPMLTDGRIKVVLDSTFPLSDMALAHKRMDEGTHIGKIVLRVG